MADDCARGEKWAGPGQTGGFKRRGGELRGANVLLGSEWRGYEMGKQKKKKKKGKVEKLQK